MKFEDVLNDIEKMIGMRLEAVNSKTGFIELISISREAQNIHVKQNSGRSVSRPFSQLKTIWGHLSQNRTVNVELVLEGSGSSRNILETVFANLPYVEHFKYSRKKHLFLSPENTHELGTLKQVRGSESRKIRSVLDNLENFEFPSFSNEFRNALLILEESVRELKTKYSGEFNAGKISQAGELLSNLQSKLDNTFMLPLGDDFDNYAKNTPVIVYPDDPNDPYDLDGAEETGFTGASEFAIEGSENLGDELDENNQISASRIRFAPTTVSLIYDRLFHKEIELQPEFQRRDRIWPLKTKSALIESILIGLPIPSFYFAERSNGDWLVIDGLQRITTFYDFISNKFELTNLKFLKDYNNRSFEDLPRHFQRKIREYQLHCHIITIKKDSDKMVRELFQRINTYGIKMSFQEIRCALFPGSSVRFIRYLAESDVFKDATFDKVQPKRMRDMELVLGAVAFTLFGYDKFDDDKFDTFLTRTMQALNSYKLNSFRERIVNPDYNTQTSDNKLFWNEKGTDYIYNDLRGRIESALNLATQIFGPDRFKKTINGRVINKSLFELITSTFALLSQHDQEKLLEKKELVKSGLFDLIGEVDDASVNWISDNYDDRGFEYSISQSTGKKVTILYRFQNFQAMLEKVLGKKISLKGVLENYDQHSKIK